MSGWSSFVVGLSGMLILSLSACFDPVYAPPPANVAQATIDLRALPAPYIRIDRTSYYVAGPRLAKVAADKWIWIEAHFNGSGRCWPSVGFVPQLDVIYVVSFKVETGVCSLELRRADGKPIDDGLPHFHLRPPRLIEGAGPPA